MRVAILATVAACVDTAPAVPLGVPGTPGVAEVATFHLKASSDDVHDTCAPPGARDVSFELVSEADQTVFFDTDPDPLKTTAAVALTIADGHCPAKQKLQCTRQPCPGTPYGSIAVSLMPQHPYCLVVEEADPASSADLVTLRMFTSGRRATMVFDASAAGSMQAGTTCMGDQMAQLSCGGAGAAPSTLALVPVCPGLHHLMGSIALDQPVGFSLRSPIPAANELACFATSSPGGFSRPEPLMGPAPLWLEIERATSQCGNFQLSLAAP